MRTILNTVGTSLLKNSGLSGTPDVSSLVQFLATSELSRASAETNALCHLLKGDGEEKLVFFHSETEDGELCASALARYYRMQGYETETVLVKDLSYREKKFRSHGLRSLVGRLFEYIERERRLGNEIVINATGGFKAEGAYATLVGLLSGVPVYYIHEVFREIVELPRLPIGWDYSWIAEYEDILAFFAEDLRSRFEVEDILKGGKIPQEIRILLAEEDNFVFLSPAGQAVFSAYQMKLKETPPTPVYCTERALKWYREADATVQERIRRILRKLSIPEVRRSRANRSPKVPCFVYPRQRYDERLFFCEEEGRIVVCAITRHGDKSYEGILSSGLSCKRRGKLVEFPDAF